MVVYRVHTESGFVEFSIPPKIELIEKKWTIAGQEFTSSTEAEEVRANLKKDNPDTKTDGGFVDEVEIPLEKETLIKVCEII